MLGMLGMLGVLGMLGMLHGSLLPLIMVVCLLLQLRAQRGVHGLLRGLHGRLRGRGVGRERPERPQVVPRPRGGLPLPGPLGCGDPRGPQGAAAAAVAVGRRACRGQGPVYR